MRIVVLDFETYFNRASGYTLDKLSTEAYIRNPQFKAHGAAIKWSENIPARWYDERMLRHVLKEEDWSETLLVAHHCQFDGLILTQNCGVTPRAWGCTLSMARLILGNHISVGLDSVRKHFGLPVKSTPYGLMDGKTWADMGDRTRELVAEGACDEVESIWYLFHKFIADGFPLEELKIIDLTIRMFVVPKLLGDVDLLATLWESENTRKQQHLTDLGVTAAELQSSEKFAKLLRDCAVDPLTKPGKKGAIYAFAKTDQFMRELLEHDDARVRALAEARIGQKSTLLQTRAATLGYMATRGPLPVYLRYCGAHTTRWSGGDGCNWQNFRRPREDDEKKGVINIRKAIMAPDGYLLAAIDSSQIECRLLNYLAGQMDVVERFAKGEDIYVGIATQFYGRQITGRDKAERGTGKQLELSCGYGCGGARFRATAKLGLYGPSVNLTELRANEAVQLYRRTHANVVAYWRAADGILATLAKGDKATWGPMEIRARKIILANGAPLNYDTLEWHTDEEKKAYWRLLTRAGFVKLYGAKLVENCLSGTTKVLTHRGWKRIIDVMADDLLWDGVAWVKHAGLRMTGRNTTAWLNGVRMTADHEVLAINGWVRAAQAQGLQRANVCLPDGYSGCWHDWQKENLGSPVHMWEPASYYDRRMEETQILRLSQLRGYAPTENAWHVATSRLLGLAVNARSLSTSYASCLEELWCAGYQGLQALGRKFRSFLGGYGSYVPTWFNSRAQRQRQGLYQNQLHLDRPSTTSPQSADQQNYRDSMGTVDGRRSSPVFGPWCDDLTLSDCKRMALEELVYQTRFYEPTYDLMNCGPQHRFVVMGNDGPFIVHNCVQALARVVLSQAMIAIDQELKLPILTCTHDEVVLLISDNSQAEELTRKAADIMRRSPSWLPGIPLDAEYTIGKRYSK